MGVRNEEDVAFGGKPLEISETFLQGIPVVPEVFREGQCLSELIEETRRRSTFLALDRTHQKPGGSCDYRGGRTPAR